MDLHRSRWWSARREKARRLRPVDWNGYFLPAYFGRFPPADFHADLDDDLHELHKRRGTKQSYIAPRGGAKSTWVTEAYPLRAACEGWEPYSLILSDSASQANELLRHIRVELEGNPRLAEIYPNAVGIGPEWKENRLRLRNGCVIEALGTGSKIRGRRNRQSRPSLVVFDDVQSNEDITSPVQREKAWAWATREVIPAGDENTNFLSVGSALHRESVSIKLGMLPGWVGKTYQAIHQWPERMDLWSEFERIASNLADENRGERALAFHEENRAAMLAGAEWYWPARLTLADLMLKRAEIGEAAFEAEYQGNPGSGLHSEWPPSYFDWDGFWFDQWPEVLAVKVLSVDPSKGAGEESDYQAHVLAGLGYDGTIYLDAVLEREDVTRMIGRSIDLAVGWGGVTRMVVEDNATMGLLAPEIERQVSDRSFLVPWETLTNVEPKAVRIRRAGPYLARKQIRVRNTRGGRMLVEQWRDFPTGDKVDGPDAAGTAIKRLELLTLGV